MNAICESVGKKIETVAIEVEEELVFTFSNDGGLRIWDDGQC